MTAARTRPRGGHLDLANQRIIPTQPPRPAEPTTGQDCCTVTLVATFRREQLVALEHRHAWWCEHPAQPVDIAEWRQTWT